MRTSLGPGTGVRTVARWRFEGIRVGERWEREVSLRRIW